MDNDIKPPSAEPNLTPKPETNIQPGQDAPQPGQEAKAQAAPPDPKLDPLDIHEAKNTKSLKKW